LVEFSNKNAILKEYGGRLNDNITIDGMGKYVKSYVNFFWLTIEASEWIFLNGKNADVSKMTRRFLIKLTTAFIRMEKSYLNAFKIN